MIDRNIKAVLFHQNSISVNFKSPRGIRLPDEKPSVIFASAYFVPDAFANYCQIRVIESMWMHQFFFFFFERNTLSFARGHFLRRAWSRGENKMGNDLRLGCCPQRWPGSVSRYDDGRESDLIYLWLTSCVKLINHRWAPIGEDLAHVCPFQPELWLLSILSGKSP